MSKYSPSVVVCGSRDFTMGENEVWHLILVRLSRLSKDTLVMHGEARGVDRMAGRVARSLGLEVKAYPAKWKDEDGSYNRGAGLQRNLYMLEQNPDLVIAFYNGKSKGTAHTVREAREMDIPVEVIPII